MEAAALRVRIEDIGSCPQYQLTFVRLADINMDSSTHNYGIEHLFKQWTDKRLQWSTLDWNGESCETCQYRGMSRCYQAYLSCGYASLCGMDTLHFIVPDIKSCHFGALDDIDPK